jgi:Zn-dependent protease with chaperone function
MMAYTAPRSAMTEPKKPSFLLRAIIAVLLLAGFYVLGLVIVAACLATVWLQFKAGHIFPKLILLAVIAAATVAYGMLRSLFMTSAKFEPPGPEITEEEEPELFAVIRDVAAKMDATMPRHVYLMPDVNAFVAEVGGFYGIGTRRVMGIGVGLLQVDTVQQLKATLAHEFGHYAGGDTHLGGFLYRTRAGIIHTLQHLGGGMVASIFVSYFQFFLRVTQKISREQELAADQASVRIAGTRAHVLGLRREARGGALFGLFLRHDVSPLVNAGYRPNELYAGFRRASKEMTKGDARDKLDAALADQVTNEYDTHPALPERIAYAESLPRVEMAEDDRRARLLLKDPAATEKRVGKALLARSCDLGKLEAIAWKDAGSRVFGPLIEKDAENRRSAMQKVGIPAATLLEAAESAIAALDLRNVTDWVRKLEPKIEDVNARDREAIARSIAAKTAVVCLGTELVRRGAKWEAECGREVEVKENEIVLPIFTWASEAVKEADAREKLRDRIRALRS